ncbi:MAG: glycosyltransferase family 4 protein, partial [Blastochloris sp.]|nr:glycosyltransferase family 4 protein [Blastochloris sp.]
MITSGGVIIPPVDSARSTRRLVATSACRASMSIRTTGTARYGPMPAGSAHRRASMACAVPSISGDLPAVRELVRDGVDGLLVRPDRPAALARAVRVLLDYPHHIPEMAHRPVNELPASLHGSTARRNLLHSINVC